MLLTFLLFIGLTCSVQFSRREKLETKYWDLTPRTSKRSFAVGERLPYFLPSLNREVTPDDYFKFIPRYIGSVFAGGKPLKFSTECFRNNEMTVSRSNNDTFVVKFNTQNKSSLFCTDTYIIAFVGSLDISPFASSLWAHHITFKGPWSEAELYDVVKNGIRVFHFPSGLVATAHEIFETTMLFFGAMIGTNVPKWTADKNLEFLRNHMNYHLPERNITDVVIDKKTVQSGDMIGVLRLDGLDPMLSWAMGSRMGHTCVALWMDGELYVCESTAQSPYWDKGDIQKHKWDDWMKKAKDAHFNVVYFRLSDEIAKRFDTKKAVEFYKSVEGLPYGFHNQFTGWVDTAEDNYPPPLSSHLTQLLAVFGDWLLQDKLELGETFDFVRQGLNHRLKTKDLPIEDAYMEASKRGMSFTEFVTMPERDEWVYHNGKGYKDGISSVCDVFLMRVWKAGGVFGNLTNQIQATEFTDWDAYSLKIFAKDQRRPPACVKADPTLPYCQLLGKHRMDMGPDWNKYEPFAKMRERCPSLPPKYENRDRC